MKNMTRRGLLGAASVAWATTFLGKPARAAAEFEFKLGVNTPDTHPDRPPHRGRACDRGTVGRATRGHGFPQHQFGGDPETLSQLRAGGIERLAAPSMSLSTLVPLSGFPSVGFAFQSL